MIDIVNVVAASRKEAGLLAASGFHHGTLAEANETLAAIRRTGDPYYANQYRVFRVLIRADGMANPANLTPTKKERS